MPKFIGPYVIVKLHPETSTYVVNLPDELATKQIHTTFHVSKLCVCEPNDKVQFPKHNSKFFYNSGLPQEDEWLVNLIISH